MNPTINGPRHDRSTTTATLHPPGADWDASFDEPVAAQVSRRATRGRVAFWLLAAVFAATMLGTTLPTPLYVIYQARWHFSAAMVTVTFAVYAAAVLATLLLAGRSSDQAGRKPVLAGVLSEDECQQLIELARPRLARSTVVDPRTGVNATADYRNSEGMFFRLEESSPMTKWVRTRRFVTG